MPKVFLKDSFGSITPLHIRWERTLSSILAACPHCQLHTRNQPVRISWRCTRDDCYLAEPGSSGSQHEPPQSLQSRSRSLEAGFRL